MTLFYRPNYHDGPNHRTAGRWSTWTNADSALQVFGGMGYALETPISRVLCDARILSVFEGTAEIQAQIIARGLLQKRN